MQDPSLKSTKLYVGHIPHDVAVDELTDYFKPFGAVIDAYYVRDKVTQKNVGTGFVVMDVENASDALDNLNGKVLRPGARGLVVEYAKRDDGIKVFVGGLPKSFSITDAKTLFKEFGTPEEIILFRDHQTRMFKGACFVVYPDRASCEACINSLKARGRLDNFPDATRDLEVKYAVHKEERPANPPARGLLPTQSVSHTAVPRPLAAREMGYACPPQYPVMQYPHHAYPVTQHYAPPPPPVALMDPYVYDKENSHKRPAESQLVPHGSPKRTRTPERVAILDQQLGLGEQLDPRRTYFATGVNYVAQDKAVDDRIALGDITNAPWNRTHEPVDCWDPPAVTGPDAAPCPWDPPAVDIHEQRIHSEIPWFSPQRRHHKPTRYGWDHTPQTEPSWKRAERKVFGHIDFNAAPWRQFSIEDFDKVEIYASSMHGLVTGDNPNTVNLYFYAEGKSFNPITHQDVGYDKHFD